MRSRRTLRQQAPIFLLGTILLLSFLEFFGVRVIPRPPRPFHSSSISEGARLGTLRAKVVVNNGASAAQLASKYGDVEMVVASLQRENLTWLDDYLLDWSKNIYVVDDSSAALTVPKNKGREAMVFLTYIIDRYDSLPANVIFHHAERFQWHNDNPDYDALPLLQRFRFEHLYEEGYVNLRCVWILGCPSEINPAVDEVDEGQGSDDEPVHAKHVYKKAYRDLFPERPVPTDIGVSCCSQFAVRRETIRARPKKDYVRYREWLLSSQLDDALSGRVLEYSWHMIFGKESVHCPAAGECYCQTYGLCEMSCEKDKCLGQYTLPPYSTLPQGWPMIGWEHEDRGWKGQP